MTPAVPQLHEFVGNPMSRLVGSRNQNPKPIKHLPRKFAVWWSRLTKYGYRSVGVRYGDESEQRPKYEDEHEPDWQLALGDLLEQPGNEHRGRDKRREPQCSTTAVPFHRSLNPPELTGFTYGEVL
jgi:hypothetical protein